MASDQKIDSLEERLRQHAKAFDGLMALIPAKEYYGEDHSEQWQRTKQSKKEAKAARKAKLDPNNYKSAKDVLDEMQAAQRKRKRAEGQDENNMGASNGSTLKIAPESSSDAIHPSKKLKKARGDSVMRKATEGSTSAESTIPEGKARRAQTKVEKRQLKQEQRTKSRIPPEAPDSHERPSPHRTSENTADSSLKAVATQRDGDASPRYRGAENAEALESKQVVGSPATPSSPADSVRSDSSPDRSDVSSMTSILPPTSPDRNQSPAHPHKAEDVKPQTQPKSDPEELRKRLHARIEAMRAARNADGPDGTSPRSRQELLDSRRRKEEARQAYKKEQRRLAKEEEARKRAEFLERGSPLMSPGGSRPVSVGDPANLTFGNVDFGKGISASADLNSVIDTRKNGKGPSDPGTALVAAQKKEARLAGYDAAKREDILEKDRWLNAKKRAQGERIRDDGSLLKQTLKRKEKQKKKSQSDWRERIEGVKKRAERKQKKREANLAKRKDEKGGKGSSKGKKVKNRPGFEGSFRAKAPR